MKCTEKIGVAPPQPSMGPRRFAWRRTNLRAVSSQFQKISMLFSTPGGGRFSRAPPFMKTPGIHVHRSMPTGSSFVKSNTSAHSRFMSAFAGERKGFAESLPGLCIEVRHAQARGLQFVDSLQA